MEEKGRSGGDDTYNEESNGSNRRLKERRKKPSKGYTYISIVGWIDRREKIRRQDDGWD
jgi:hypothetical protein